MTRRNMIGAGCLVLILVVMAGALGWIVKQNDRAERECLNDIAKVQPLITARKPWDAEQALTRAVTTCAGKHEAQTNFLKEKLDEARADEPVVAERLARVDSEWAIYDRMHSDKKTAEQIRAAFALGALHAAGISAEAGARVMAYNQAQRRRRTAPLMFPNAGAMGANFEVLVPGIGHSCVVFAKQLLSEPDGVRTLRELGFTSMHCDEGEGDGNIPLK